ncbi:NAD-dependent dehydratase [Simiduia aestuariiviva]|uniref:Uncharacterized protein YbjT (DUF2867 family) n=1 Tax=Simiduia aestuariiviva TaxID=1510459 RepID=A0A839UIU1_9GAMM|nr:NAD-dependent dehydratase [Simiduia aestuariiviva]MBB3167463.1 uncharacterized protein YbjT (DUF2867 family) [Simiduia aestuariiviva]
MRVLILGATGAVGGQLLAESLARATITSVIAPTRRPLPPHPKLINPVLDFSEADAEADFWHVDVALCALGTTRKQAGSDAAFIKVDKDIPIAVAQCVLAKNAHTFGLVSSVGARLGRNLYLNTKAELELALQALGFAHTVIVRPSLIDAHRADRRPGESLGLWLAKALGKLLPARYRPVPPAVIAKALLNASLAKPVVQGSTTTTLESEQLKKIAES